MTNQKFQKGNIVEVISGSWKGTQAVVDGTYAELYWGNNRKDYSLTDIDSGSSFSWVDEKEMKLIHVGGREALATLEETKRQRIENNTDLDYILENWNNKDVNLENSDTIKFLFNKIGFDSSFNYNGEYFILFSDWNTLLPLFNFIVYANEFSEVEKFLNPKLPEDMKNSIKDFYEEVRVCKENNPKIFNGKVDIIYEDNNES